MKRYINSPSLCIVPQLFAINKALSYKLFLQLNKDNWFVHSCFVFCTFFLTQFSLPGKLVFLCVSMFIFSSFVQSNKTRLRNDPLYVEWEVEVHSDNQSVPPKLCPTYVESLLLGNLLYRVHCVQ